MIEDIGADEYKIEENEKEYLLRIGSITNKIYLNISTKNNKQFKNYTGEFTLDDLQRINRVFLLTRSIYEAKEEFKKAIERKKIAISEKEDYIHIVFYMMIGTDTSTLSVALPRDETPRIIRLEQNINILKLGRDNLSNRLAVFEREAEEIKKDIERIQLGNTTLSQIVDTVGQGIPDVSEIIKEYRANLNNPNYSSYKGFDDAPYSSSRLKGNDKDQPYSSARAKKGNDNDQPYSSARARGDNDQPYSSVRAKGNDNDQPYSSARARGDNDQPYSSRRIKGEDKDQPYTSYNPDQPYSSANYKNGDIEPIKESLNEQNRDSSMPNENNQGNFNLDVNNLENPSMDSNDDEKFPNGIIKNIIKEPEEIENVLSKINEKYPGSTYKLLYKGSKHGDGAADFHSRCDDAEKTLIIIEDNYGNRFGGFTTQDWGGEYMQKKDDDAFIFSIDKNKIYDVIPDQNAIGCYPNFGPVFFGCQIRIYDNFLTKGGTTYKKGLNYRTTEDFELTNGKQNFGVRDMEVYEVDNQNQ